MLALAIGSSVFDFPFELFVEMKILKIGNQ